MLAVEAGGCVKGKWGVSVRERVPASSLSSNGCVELTKVYYVVVQRDSDEIERSGNVIVVSSQRPNDGRFAGESTRHNAG